MKKILTCALALVLALSLSACAAADEPVRVFALKGPTGIGMVGVMENHPDAYDFTLAGAGDEIVAAIASGSADIAACPTNLAATLYNKTNGNVQLMALNTLGVLHVVSSDHSIDSFDDLAGRKVYATGQASVPEYVVRYILEQGGLTDKVELEFVAEHSELATLMAAGKAEIGILPEPYANSHIQESRLTALGLSSRKLSHSQLQPHAKCISPTGLGVPGGQAHGGFGRQHRVVVRALILGSGPSTPSQVQYREPGM